MPFAPIRVLGGVRLEGPDGDVRVGGVVAERLLGALVATGGAPILSAVLAEAVWPAASDGDPLPRLRMAVSRLRHRLADAGVDDAVVATRSAYRLAVAPTDVDAELFVTMLDTARRVRSSEPDRAAALFDGALALWRGEPFGSLGSEPWAMGPAAHLHERKLAAEEELADLDLLRHREAVAVDRLRLAVQEEPLRERRWVQLATALYRLGRQADALRAVEQARSVLREQLGIDPGDGLRSIERGLLEQDPTLLQSEASVAGTLPSPERLVGRDADVEELTRLVDANRMVTIHGLGGVGKSTIARAVARRQDLAGRAVVVAHLDGVADPEAVWLAVATAAGLAGAEDPADLPAAIAGRLSTRPTVLLLDGAEAGLATASEVADSLRVMTSSVKLLVTSRVPLGATGELRYALDALPIGGDDGEGPAVELFLERAGFSPAQLNDTSRAQLVRVCELAGGLPLALELAAASADLHGVAALASGESGARGAEVLDNMVRWSLSVLPTDSVQLLSSTSLLPDGTSTAAAACLGDVPEASVRRLLAPLVQAQLLGVTGRGSSGLRYRAPEAVREIATALIDPSDVDAAESLVIGHLIAVTAAVGEYGERARLEAVPAAEDELGNVRHWLGRTRGSTIGLELAVAATQTLVEVGLGAEGSRWLQQHREAAADAEPLLQARATVSLCATQEFVPDPQELEQASRVLEEHGAWRQWLYLRGRLVLAVGRVDPPEAERLLHEPLVLERVAIVDDPWMDLQVEWLSGVAPAWSGRFAEAQHNLDGVPGRFLALDATSDSLFVLYVQALVARAAGDLAGAARYLGHARELAATSVSRGSQARIAAELAHLARASGDPAAVPMLVLAIDQLERSGTARSAATERRDLGGWRVADGDVEGGLADLRAALPMLLRIDRGGAAVALAVLAEGIASTRPVDAARLAGAVARILTTASAATPAQGDEVTQLARLLQAGSEQGFTEGGGMEDEVLLEVALAG